MTKIYQNINFLLRELFIVKQKYDYKYEQEEKFNVFTALHKWNDERRLHSRFLSVLLNPNGSHGKGATFLELFLKQVKIDLGQFENIEVLPNEIDKSEYRNIDIFIFNKIESKALIIENKIGAGDSNNEEDGQLERYYNRIKNDENYDEVYTIYLTLDGREPSEESLGEYENLENINGQCIAYGNEILIWLNECLKHTTQSPFIRETIIQYKNLIEDMTQNELDIEHRKELVEIIGRDDVNMEAAKQLFENYKHIKWHTVDYFWNELIEVLEENELKVIERPTEEEITSLTHYEVYKKGIKAKQETYVTLQLKNGIKLSIAHSAQDLLYFGCYKEDVKGNITKIRSTLNNEFHIYNSNKDWLYWKDFFDKEEEKQIRLSNFTHKGTFNLINKEYRTERIQEIVEEVKAFAAILEEI